MSLEREDEAIDLVECMTSPLQAPTPAARAAAVRAMFGRTVARYDLLNTLMTGGQDAAWRRATAAALGTVDGVVLDLGCGTGALAAALCATGGRVVGLDFSLPMLRVARRRASGRWTVSAGDALALPFADSSLAAAATAFTLRNVVDLPGALAELARVLRPGGRLAVLELSHATGVWRLPLAVHREVIVPLLGRLLSSDPAAYRYLPASLRLFPTATALGALIAAAGFRDVRWRTWFGGAVALHVGERAGSEGPAACS